MDTRHRAGRSHLAERLRPAGHGISRRPAVHGGQRPPLLRAHRPREQHHRQRHVHRRPPPPACRPDQEETEIRS